MNIWKRVSSEYQDHPEIRRYMGNCTGNVHGLNDESCDHHVCFHLCDDDDDQEVEIM
jgi:deferrochelatase/peroxidase EfeB